MKFNATLASTVLSVIASAGVVATAVLVAKGTPKATKLIEEAEKEKYAPLTDFEKVQVSLPAYIPAIAVGAATIAAIIGGNVLTVKQAAQMSAAYALLDQSFKKYQGKLKDIFGIDTDLTVKQAISNEKHPLPEKLYEEITKNSSEKRLFCVCDGTEDIFFWSTMEKVLEAEMTLNRDLTCEPGEHSLEYFLDNLSEDELIFNRDRSRELGWSCDMMGDWYGYVWVDFDHVIENKDSDDPDNPPYVRIVPFADPVKGYDTDNWVDNLTA